MGFDTHTGLLAVSQRSRKRTSGFRFSARFKGLIAYSCLPDLLIAILVQAFPLTTNKRLTSATIHTLYRFTLRFRYCVVHGETGIQHPSCLYIPRSVERLVNQYLAFTCLSYHRPALNIDFFIPSLCNRCAVPLSGSGTGWASWF